MKSDIESREDIELLVDSFYIKVKQDEIIGHIFNIPAHFNWEKHIPVMYGFWDTVLLGKAGYKGNPIRTHIELNRTINLNDVHFERWLELFNATVNEHFMGQIAERAKEKAQLMANLIRIKIEDSKQPGFVQ